MEDNLTQINKNLKNEDVLEFIDNPANIILLYQPNSNSTIIQEEIIEDIFEKYSKQVSFAYMDVLENQDLAISEGIRSFPSILFYKEGKLENITTGINKNIENIIMSIL